MIEFYVAYQRDGRRFVAVVLAPKRPPALRFSNREEFLAGMDGLEQSWQLKAELEGDLPDESLEELAKTGEFRAPRKRPDSIFSFGSIPYMGSG